MLLSAAVALAATAGPSSAGAQPARDRSVLDVPYLPQSEALCGGAAVAMVMRYWGERAVYAETFADLVDAEAGGIRGRDLIRALDRRGFTAVSVAGDVSRVRAALGSGIPVIALMEDRPGRFHYVVIVGWFEDRVIVHDPARAPFRVVAQETFLRAWHVSGNWTLIAQPQAQRMPKTLAAGAPAHVVAAGPADGGGACSGMVEEGIRLAGQGDLTGAQRILDLAAADCARDAGPWRELAGLHALKGEWGDAARDASRAIDRDPSDAHAIRILATSLFLEGKDDAALGAWNRLGEPFVDVTNITGLERTRFGVVAGAVDLPSETRLTGERLDSFQKATGGRSGADWLADRVRARGRQSGRRERDRARASAAADGAAADGGHRVARGDRQGSRDAGRESERWGRALDRILALVGKPSAPVDRRVRAVADWRRVVGRRLRRTTGLRPSRRNGVGTSQRRRAHRIRLDYRDPQDRRGSGLRPLDGRRNRFTPGRGRKGVRLVARNGHRLDGVLMAGAYTAGLVNLAVDWQSTLDRVGSSWLLRGGFTSTTSAGSAGALAGSGDGAGAGALCSGRIRCCTTA